MTLTNSGLHGYFEEQADKTPNHIALKFNDQVMTYKELEGRANQVAHYLRSHKVGPNAFVGIVMDRSFEMIIGILGALKAGAAYVPIDPEYPKERIQFLIEDIEAPVILTCSQFKGLFSTRSKIANLDEQWDEDFSIQKTSRLELNSTEDTAYMIYTSGSTGTPKGCQISHRAILNFLLWSKTKFTFKEQNNVLQKNTYTFDFSVLEIFWPLISGCTLIIAKPGGHKDTAYMVDMIKAHSITTIMFVPSVLQVMMEENGFKECTSLKEVLVGGEALRSGVVKQFHKLLPKTKLTNLYGPTEAAIASTYWDIDFNKETSPIPIGFAIPNNKLYILDEQKKPVPQGESGELYIGGDQVGSGYLKSAELTKEKFLKDPFSQNSHARMYRTGDRCRVNSIGAVEYEGRIDFQVKIRGFRVELGEIESVLLQHPTCKQVAVIAKKLHGEEGPLSIVAFMVNKENKKNNLAELKQFLISKIPDYMIPASILNIDDLPLTNSGKVDRKALASLADTIATDLKDSNYASPQTEIEKIMVEIWEDILKVKPIGRHSNYFGVGGDSLNMLRILHRLKKYNLNLNLDEFNRTPIVSNLAELLEQKKGKFEDDFSLPPVEYSSKNAKAKQYPLSYQQALYRKKFLTKNNSSYIFLCNSLEGSLNVAAFKKSIEKIMSRHWVLKTKVITVGQSSVQMIQPPEAEYFVLKDFRSLPEEDIEAAVEKEILENYTEKIDLTKGSPLRCYLSRAHDEQYYVVIKVDHILFDALSMQIFINELNELYAAEIENRAAQLSDISAQYVDFAEWEQSLSSDSKGVAIRLSYWKSFFKDIPLFSIPKDQKSLESSSQRESGCVNRTIDNDLANKLISSSKKLDVTLNAIVLSSFSLCLHKLNKQNEIVFNILTSLRPSGLENLMGCFMQMFPVRVSFKNNPTPLSLLTQLKNQIFNAYSHIVPQQLFYDSADPEDFENLLKSSDIQFNYIAAESNSLNLLGITCEPVEMDISEKSASFISIEFYVLKDNLFYSIIFNKQQYVEKSILKMAHIFEESLLEMAQQSL